MTNQEEWIARLLAAFGGNLEGWTWTGEIRIDDARTATCACGQHGLRYLFPWTKDGHEEVITGSVCVVNLPGLAGDQVERVKTELARRAEVDRELKAEAREEERLQMARQLADEIRGIWPRVYEVETRRGCGEKMTAAELQLLRRHHALHEEFRAAIRLRTPKGRIRKLLMVKAELLRGLQPQQEQPHA